MKQYRYDMTFVGAGLSCTYTLIHYLNSSLQLKKKDKIRLLIIEKTNEFWTGIPYGNRSGPDSLIITSLKEFLPESERESFISWLKENVNWEAKGNSKKGLKFSEKWLQNNQALISNNAWESLFIPRHIFGNYLKERVERLLKVATDNEIIEYELLTADVTDIVKKESGYTIKANVATNNEIAFSTTKVILSIGSPPKQYLNTSLTLSEDICIIEDMYDPDIRRNINRIYESLRSSNWGEQNNILILGSNASSLEILYNIERLGQLESLVNHFYILSPDGVFPNLIKKENLATNYTAENLSCLKNIGSCTSNQILEAVKMDTEIAHKKNIDISDIYHPMSSLIIELLDKLDMEEQKKFVFKDGVEIGKFQRRAGAEYLNVVERLVSQQKISLIKGRFLKQSFTENGGFRLEYMDTLTGEKKMFPYVIKVLINCTGFQSLSNSSSALIRQLVEQQICKINGSERGFEVNEDFEANENFYVIGPILAGNLNSKLRVWHAESCPRILKLSSQLAEVLL